MGVVILDCLLIGLVTHLLLSGDDLGDVFDVKQRQVLDVFLSIGWKLLLERYLKLVVLEIIFLG